MNINKLIVIFGLGFILGSGFVLCIHSYTEPEQKPDLCIFCKMNPQGWNDPVYLPELYRVHTWYQREMRDRGFYPTDPNLLDGDWGPISIQSHKDWSVDWLRRE